MDLIVVLLVAVYWLVGLGVLAMVNGGPRGVRPPSSIGVFVVALWPIVAVAVGVAVVVGWGMAAKRVVGRESRGGRMHRGGPLPDPMPRRLKNPDDPRLYETGGGA